MLCFIVIAQYVVIDFLLVASQFLVRRVPIEFMKFVTQSCFLPSNDLIPLPDSASVCCCSMPYRFPRETSGSGPVEANRSRSRLGDRISGSASSTRMGLGKQRGCQP